MDESIKNFAIHWKTGDAPGVTIRDGVIVEWPAALGERPTAEEIAEWVVEFVAADTIVRKTAEVDAHRDALIAAGCPYAFPDGLSGTIQTRNDNDFINISGIAAAGLALMVTQSAETLVFLDCENVLHTLTGAQAVAMGMAVMAWRQGIYSASWHLKRTVFPLLTPQNLAAFDVAANWPK